MESNTENDQGYANYRSVDQAGKHQSTDFAGQAKSAANKVNDTFVKAVGIEKLEGFSLKALFSDVFKKHPEEEVDRSFMCGTPETTPDIRDVDSSWPRPWIFMRALIASVVIYWALHSGYRETNNLFLLPSMMFVGAFAVPISALMFFIESNVRRNISLYQIFRLLLFGGVAGVVWASLTWKFVGDANNNYVTAILAGLIEEPVKLAALWKCRSLLKHRYVHNGLLVGAALGAGFAAFESMGYAFVSLLKHGEMKMESVILIRGVLAPLGHIIWTAIVCASLWRVKGDSQFRFGMFFDKRFLRLAALPVVLHILWDLPSIPVVDNVPLLRYPILGLIGWIAVLSLLQEGLKEIRREKLAVIRDNDESVETSTTNED